MATSNDMNGHVESPPGHGGSSNASSRVLRKLQLAIESGNFYEAHQTYRSLYFRYMTQKKYEELLQLLYDGTIKLLDHRQATSGCDLALLLTEVLDRASFPVEEKILDRIECIFERLIRIGCTLSTVDHEDTGEEKSTTINDISSNRDAFVANLIKWTKNVSPKYKRGHPSLHARLATTWWRMENYEQSRYHFLQSNDGEGCATFLIEYHLNKGYPNEVDLFITQAVLQYLCHKEKSMADTVFFKYTRNHPFIGAAVSVTSENSATISKNATFGEPPYFLPLLNFVWLLLLCIDTGRLTDYTILIEKYQPSIKRDPSYTDFLDRIGQHYFGLPPPNRKTTGGGAFLSNLMAGLLGDENDNADEGQSSAEETFESVPGTPVASRNDVQRPPDAKMAVDEALD